RYRRCAAENNARDASGDRGAQVMGSVRGALALACLATWLAGCATTTRPQVNLTPLEELEPEVVPAPTMLVEYPPIEAVESQPSPSAAATSATAEPGEG